MKFFGGFIHGDPVALVAFHKWMTVFWFLAAAPICLLLSNSLPFIVFVSVYAVVTGHWSSWQAGRTEVKQDIADEADPNT